MPSPLCSFVYPEYSLLFILCKWWTTLRCQKLYLSLQALISNYMAQSCFWWAGRNAVGLASSVRTGAFLCCASCSQPRASFSEGRAPGAAAAMQSCAELQVSPAQQITAQALFWRQDFGQLQSRKKANPGASQGLKIQGAPCFHGKFISSIINLWFWEDLLNCSEV